ncbi:hypothetical protein J2X34_000971 [Rhodococcus sp. BE178]
MFERVGEVQDRHLLGDRRQVHAQSIHVVASGVADVVDDGSERVP